MGLRTFQFAKFLFEFFLNIIGHFFVFASLLKFKKIFCIGILAKFFLYGFQLLAQEIIALSFFNILSDFRFNVAF